MRLSRSLWPTIVVVGVATSTPVSAADRGDTVGIVELQAAVAGELADGFVDSNPCEGAPPYVEYRFEPTGQAMAGSVTYTYDVMAEVTPESKSASWFVSGGGYADFYGTIDVATYESVTITHRKFHVGCVDPANPGVIDPATDAVVWVPVVTEASLVPDLMAEITRLVPAPNAFFPVAMPDTGWLIVNTPMEVRVDNLAPVTATVTAANAVSSATATATATASEVVFEPGESGGAAVTCSTDDVEAAWDRDDPDGSGCVYTYRNSSAITDSDRFQARTRVRWHVVGSGGLDMIIETIGHDPVAVAEVQAVVVAP